MEWWIPVLGLLGSFAGATLPGLIQLRNARGVRAEDAYIDLAGACQLLMALSNAIGEDSFRSTDEAWVRFGLARGKVFLQEKDDRLLVKMRLLAGSLDQLYKVKVPLNGGEL